MASMPPIRVLRGTAELEVSPKSFQACTAGEMARCPRHVGGEQIAFSAGEDLPDVNGIRAALSRNRSTLRSRQSPFSCQLSVSEGCVTGLQDVSWAEVLGPAHPAAASSAAPWDAQPPAGGAHRARQLAAAAITATASAANEGSEAGGLPPEDAPQGTEPSSPQSGSGASPAAAQEQPLGTAATATTAAEGAAPVAPAAAACESNTGGAVRAARDAVVAALADEFAARVPDGAVSIARLQVGSRHPACAFPNLSSAERRSMCCESDEFTARAVFSCFLIFTKVMCTCGSTRPAVKQFTP